VLLIAGMVAMETLARVGRTWPLAVVGGLLLALVAARAANLVDAKALAMNHPLGRRLIDASTKLDRRSFGWRLRVEERAARIALKKPVLGSGRWDWWRTGPDEERPWGLVSLTLGNFGFVGWSLLLGIFAAPIAAFLWTGPPGLWMTPNRAPAAALAGALVIVGLDAILNPCVTLIFAAVAGGLVGLKGHVEAASAWIRRAQGLLR
jgi:hypothetical protein